MNKIRGDHDASEKLYTTGLTLAPDHASLLGNYAMFLKKVRRDYVKAEEMFR
jgi:Tfp pilus assembly protein PilF